MSTPLKKSLYGDNIRGLGRVCVDEMVGVTLIPQPQQPNRTNEAQLLLPECSMV